MSFLARIVAKWKFVLLLALAKLGFWGVGAVALLDSSTIPVPMDAILAVYVWNDKSHFWLYCLLAAAGSAVGGLLPYGLGRAGGELFLLKRVNRKRWPSFVAAWSAGWCSPCWCSSWVRERWMWWRTTGWPCWPS
jgi:membrane protein YqaA with SNARE-associated domain